MAPNALWAFSFIFNLYLLKIIAYKSIKCAIRLIIYRSIVCSGFSEYFFKWSENKMLKFDHEFINQSGPRN